MTALLFTLAAIAVLGIARWSCLYGYDRGYDRGYLLGLDHGRRRTIEAAHRDTLVAFRRELFTVDALPAVDLEELN